MKNTLADLNRLVQEGNLELTERNAIVTHKDENIANNRLFVWNFEVNDLEEYIRIFNIYKAKEISMQSRNELNTQLRRKMNSMLKEGYIPVECMLYASKVINSKISNDHELIDILAELIRNVYLSKPEETLQVLHNIIDSWAWIPQLRIVISAVSLIGDNELLDKILNNFSSDERLRITVFYAFLQNKTEENLKRVMQIILNLSNESTVDLQISKIFKKEIQGFGNTGIEYLKKYYDNRVAYGKLGNKTIKQGLINMNVNLDKEKDIYMYMNRLAKESRRDPNAYNEFLQLCKENPEKQGAYVARFSLPTIADDFLIPYIEQPNVSTWNRNVAIISLGHLGRNGYKNIKTVLQRYKETNQEAWMVAMMLNGDDEAVKKFADRLSQKPEFENNSLFGLVINAGIAALTDLIPLVQQELYKTYLDLVTMRMHTALENFSSNLQVFWGKKLFSLISGDLLNAIIRDLKTYAYEQTFTEETVISLLEVLLHRFGNSVEKIMFLLYQSDCPQNIRMYILKTLKGMDIQPPK